jgi:hypothetical protein
MTTMHAARTPMMKAMNASDFALRSRAKLYVIRKWQFEVTRFLLGDKFSLFSDFQGTVNSAAL